MAVTTCVLAACSPSEPEPHDDQATVVEDQSVLIPVLDNDRHANRIVVATSPIGTARVVGDSIEYTPPPDFDGVVTFEYLAIHDELGSSDDPSSAVARVTVTVTPDRPRQVSQEISTPAWPTTVATGDFNGDGHLDLVTLHEDRSVMVSLQHPVEGQVPAFEQVVVHAAEMVPVGVWLVRRRSLVVTDFDQDGLADIAFASWREIVVLYNRSSSGSMQFETARLDIGDPWFADSFAIAAADLDCDGNLELITETRGSVSPEQSGLNTDRLRVFPNVRYEGGSVSHDPVLTLEPLRINSASPLRVVQDGARCDELLFVAGGELHRAALEVDGALGMRYWGRIANGTSGLSDMASEDLDGDGADELLGTRVDSSVFVLSDSSAEEIILETEGDLLALGRYDADRRTSFAVSDRCQLRFFAPSSSGPFTIESRGDQTLFAHPECPFVTGAVAADLDGDGRDEVAIAHGDYRPESAEPTVMQGVTVVWSREARPSVAP